MTADAFVVFSVDAYLRFAKNVRSPRSARSMPATRRISIAPSPSRRHPRRSAISFSFNVCAVYGHQQPATSCRLPAANPEKLGAESWLLRRAAVEELREVLELQGRGD